MSALLGILSGGAAPARGWTEAVTRLDSRSGPREETAELDGLRVAYRGRDASGYHVGQRHVVLLDGHVDNGDLLARDAGLPVDPTDSPAVAVGKLLQACGTAVLPRIEGSFALAFVDLGALRVHLVRDRFGRRPLAFAPVGRGWAWASELKCLAPFLDPRELDPDALAEIYHYRWLVGDTTLLAGVRHVLAATHVTLELGGGPTTQRYWTFKFEPDRDAGNPRAWEDRVDTALGNCLGRLAKRHRRAACLLSGGVDSSLIAAKAVDAGFERCVAVTPRFPGHPNPELEPAARVARRLGLEHLVVDVEDEAVSSALPALIWRLEEPPRHYHAFALDALFARLATEVDVVLDGNAGDALFGTREMVDLRIQSMADWCPSPIRRSVARLLPARERGPLAMLRTHLQADRWTLPFRSDAVVYSRPPSDLVRGLPPEPRPNRLVRDLLVGPGLSPMEHFQRLHVYTRNQSHTEKHDRLASPHGLSVAAPFLEPEMIAVATSLPIALRTRGRVVKPVLKDLGCRYFPADWMFARKQGFPVPIREWLSGPLRQWLSLLRDERTAARGIFRGEAFARLDPSRDFQLLWTSLTLEIAIRQLLEDDPALIPMRSGPHMAH